MIKHNIHIIKLFLLNLILWFYNINIFGQVSPQISISFEIYDNAGGQKTIYFGLDQTATDYIDFHLGESDLPPYPPTGAFDARLILPENNFNGMLSSYKDFRFASGYPFSDTVEHRLRYQSAGGATIIYFRWNLPPEVTGLLQDLATGTIINVPISGTGVYELTNFSVFNQMKLMIYYSNIVTALEDEDIKAITYILEQNYPNLFNPSTTFKYTVPETSFVNLSVYNMLGERVAELVDGELSSGQYQTAFDATGLSSGIYIVKLESHNYTQTIKMSLTR